MERYRVEARPIPGTALDRATGAGPIYLGYCDAETPEQAIDRFFWDFTSWFRDAYWDPTGFPYPIQAEDLNWTAAPSPNKENKP